VTTIRGVFVVLVGVLLASAACGKKGPPLPPLRPMPAAPTALTARHTGDRVVLRLTLPSAGVDPALALSLARVDIYARTLPAGSPIPRVEQLLKPENVVGSIEVRPPALDAAADSTPTSPTTAAITGGAAAPVKTRPAPGDVVTWTETVPTGEPTPLELTREQATRLAAQRPLWVPVAPAGLLVSMTPVTLQARYYVAVGVSDRDRLGPASATLVVPFGPVPESPGVPVLTYIETALTVTWTTAVSGAPVRVVETSASGEEQPVPTVVAPITTGSWSTPFIFGVERCFVIRRVVSQGVVSIESASADPQCTTPEDTFPPPAPVGLVAVPGPETVTLIWDPVSAPDLAGYFVLRGEGTGETLQRLTEAPVTSLQYADATTRTGVRYVYSVIAVDIVGNPSALSDRVTVDRFVPTGR